MDYTKVNKDQSWSETDSFTTERYKQFAGKIKNPAAILDVGCNTGRGGQVLKKAFPQAVLIGVDIIKERLAKIPAGIYRKTLCSSITDLNFEPNYFDAIVAGEVIEHIPTKQIDATLKNCYRMLKKDGMLLLTTPNPNAYLVKLGRNAVFKDPSHVSIMASKVLVLKQKLAGFSAIKIKGSGKAIKYISESFPLFNLFGSYLTIAVK